MSTAAFPQPILVDAVSDVVCPWCFIGKRRLDRALEQTADLDITVRWRPFPLDPDVPPEGVDRASYMVARHGSGPSARAASQSIAAEGAKDGISFAFDRIKVMPNTLNAHRLIFWAGASEVQPALVERLFQLFFQEGADVGDPDVLAGAARDAGMDGDFVANLLRTSQDTDRVIRDVFNWRRRGVQGVPTFILNDRYGLLGAQDTDDLVTVFRRLANGEDLSGRRGD